MDLLCRDFCLCVHWVPLVKRNVYSESTYCVSTMDWIRFSFSSGDLWQIISISSTNRLSFSKLFFCSCKSAARLVNQPCYNSFNFTLFWSHIWKPLWNTVIATEPSDRGLREIQEKNSTSNLKIISYSWSIHSKQWAKSSKGARVHQRWLVQWLFGFFITPNIFAAVFCSPPSSQHFFFVKEQ